MNMNRVDRARFVLLVLLATIVSGVPTTATAHQVPAFIKQSRGSGIRESEIRNILDAMEAAASQKDVDGILKYMAPTITIKITVQLGSRAQSISLTREQYRQYLQQGFQATQTRRGNYTNLKIQIAPNGKTATASYTLVEEATLEGQSGTFKSTAQETVKFERIKGQLLETAVTSKATIEAK